MIFKKSIAPAAKDLKNTENEGFSARMRGLMAEQKSVNSFAKAAGITEGAIRNYLRGGVKPSKKVLEAIARAANVSPQWLLTGEGARTPSVGELLLGTPAERDVLRLAIQDAEHILAVLKATPTAAEKADLILAVFDHYSDAVRDGTQPETAEIIDFIKEKLKRVPIK